MKTTLSWIFAVISISATILNMNKNKWSFVIFGCTNMFWASYFGYIREYAPCFLQSVFFIISVVGFLKWHKEER